MIDVAAQINAAARRVGRRTLEAGEARCVIITQSYAAPPEDVWDACTNPERLPRWFLPVTGDLKVGGRFQIERCDPPESFTATWEYGGETSWIEARLTPEPGGRTRLELEHIVPVNEHWAEFGPGAVGVGWDMTLMGLATHLSSGQPANPQEAAAWMASAEGREFIVLSTHQWRDADVTAGTDEAEAKAAANRTLAAYTSGPPAESSQS
jgi:uncharacterized protein YndB with AHSA1/START domain